MGRARTQADIDLTCIFNSLRPTSPHPTEPGALDTFMVGVLANKDIVFQVTSSLKAPSSNRTPILLDPVMVYTSGLMLLPHEAVQALVAEHYVRIFAIAAAATPASSHPDAQAEMESFSRTAAVCILECQKHLDLCEENGISHGDPCPRLRRSVLESKRACNNRPIRLRPPWTRERESGTQNEDRDDAKEWNSASSYEKWEPAVRQEPSTSAGLVYRIGSVDVVRMDHRPWSIALDRWAEKEASDDQPDSGSVVVDVLYQSQPGPGQSKRTMFVSKHSPSTSTRGTGCTLSSALATFLATRISTQEI
ncbi:hypothetical protein CF319_g8639 [Tilletia indica]|nr:hypothetical protein CF319_g8639 [Tilletia indica]